MTLDYDPLMPQSHTPIPERRTYIPAWGTQHRDLNRSLLRDGVPTGYTVRDVLPERRWAVLEDGNIMDQRTFEDHYERWISFACGKNKDGTPVIVNIARMDEHFNPQFESKPNVIEFVMTALDAAGNRVPFGFKEAEARESKSPGMFFDSSGENPLSASEVLRVYKARSAMQEIEKLAPLKAALPDASYQARVDAVLDKHGIAVDDLALGLADAPDGFDRVKVTPEELRKFEELARRESGTEPEGEAQSSESGSIAADSALAPSPPAPSFAAPCGKKCKTKAGAAAHARNCDACAAPTVEAV